MKRNDTLSAIAEYLKSEPVLTLICHVRPDGDTLGSAFGLKACLAEMGKRVTVLCGDPISPRYRFLAGGSEHLTGEPEGALVFLDVAAPAMAGCYEPYAAKADLVIDHHPTNPRFGKMNYVDPASASTGEIIYELVLLLSGKAPSTAAAEALYVAVSTDTGCFKYGNTTAETFRVAACLAACGIDLNQLNQRLFRTKTAAEMEINRLALETVRFYAGGKVATMLISHGMIEKTGAAADELESIAAVPAQIENVAAAATFKEMTPGEFKVSVRTDGRIHGGEICALFGGGGHRMAAGCTLCGSYAEVEKKIVDALTEAMKNV